MLHKTWLTSLQNQILSLNVLVHSFVLRFQGNFCFTARFFCSIVYLHLSPLQAVIVFVCVSRCVCVCTRTGEETVGTESKLLLPVNLGLTLELLLPLESISHSWKGRADLSRSQTHLNWDFWKHFQVTFLHRAIVYVLKGNSLKCF